MRIKIIKKRVIISVVLILLLILMIMIFTKKSREDIEIKYQYPYSEVIGMSNNITIKCDVSSIKFKTKKLINQTIYLSVNSSNGYWELELYDEVYDKPVCINKTIPLTFTKHLIVKRENTIIYLIGFSKKKEYYWELSDRYRLILIGNNVSTTTPTRVILLVNIPNEKIVRVPLVVTPMSIN